jgi:hypothetical protein
MSKGEIESFLTYLAVTKNVSPITQNQAFNASSSYIIKSNIPFVSLFSLFDII